jgi:hypothetical protein
MFACLSALVLSLVTGGSAQDKPATSNTNDPRVGLKAGFRDAGVAAHGLELVSTLPKPEGFFDPKEPAGPASTPRGARGTTPAAAATPDPAAPPATTPPVEPPATAPAQPPAADQPAGSTPATAMPPAGRAGAA